MNTELKIEKSTAEDKEHLLEKIVEFNAQQVPFLQKKRFIDLSYSIRTEKNLSKVIDKSQAEIDTAIVAIKASYKL